ncbi:MAG: hypothetical protein WCP30_03915 [Mycobacteriaceae bacterium]
MLTAAGVMTARAGTGVSNAGAVAAAIGFGASATNVEGGCCAAGALSGAGRFRRIPAGGLASVTWAGASDRRAAAARGGDDELRSAPPRAPDVPPRIAWPPLGVEADVSEAEAPSAPSAVAIAID